MAETTETEEKKDGRKGNIGLPFGLCKKFNIALPKDSTPRQAWDALKGKTGMSMQDVFKQLREKGKVLGTVKTGSAIITKEKNPSQSTLKTYSQKWEEYVRTPDKPKRFFDLEFEMAEKFGDDKATKNNYFENSIGEWTELKAVPKGVPDHVSPSGSTYWYTKEGVVRKADHWGQNVASCSWFIKGEKDYPISGVKVTDEKVAYIKWSDLKPKVLIYEDANYQYDKEKRDYVTVGEPKYSVVAGKFKK